MRKNILAFTVFLLAGCAMPSTSVRTIDSRPSIAIKGASASAELFIDNVSYGKADKYNGDPQVLTIEPGTHSVAIVEGSKVVYEQTIFVESEIKTIYVH